MNITINRLFYFLRVGVPTVLALSFVLATGPEVQTHLLSLINSDVPSIYGSAYKDALVKFYPLANWMSLALTWQFLTMSLLVTLIIIRIKSPRKLVWHAIASLFFTLSSFDIVSDLLHGSLTTKNLSENLFSNFVGGALIAALIVGFFSTADFVYKYVPATKRIRLIAARCSLIGAGALFCGTAYYVTLIFYNPVPAKLEAYFSAPTNGTFIVADADSGESKGNDKKRKFSLLPVDKSIASEINWTTNSLKEVELKKSKFAGRYDVFVNLLSGFCTLSDFKKHDLKGNPLILTNVEGLEFSFDPGMATFSTRSDEENASKHEVFPGDVALFSLDQNEKDKALKLTQFVGNDAFLNVSSNDNERVVLLTASLMTMNGAQASRISRVFNLKSDGRNFTVKFAPLPISDDKKKGDCSTLDTAITMHQQDTTHNTARASNATLFAGALVRIRKHGGFLQSTGDEISLSVRGSSGWIQADGLSKDKMPEYDVGELSMFQVRGNITDLVIDNVSVPPRGLSTYTAIGSLQTEFGSQGRIRVYGTANSLWKDKERLNQTKWEKLDWEPKLFVFGAFAAFISLLWPLVVKRLASNRTFEWMQ